jgi:hypothetical protein
LRLCANAADAQHEALERLAFCARAFMASKAGRDRKAKLEQLRTALEHADIVLAMRPAA